MAAGRVCPVWIGYLLLSPLRKLRQHPERILKRYLNPSGTFRRKISNTITTTKAIALVKAVNLSGCPGYLAGDGYFSMVKRARLG